jgi:transposase
VDEETVSWTERRLVIRSLNLAKKAVRGLHTRLARAQAELAALTERKRGKKVWHDVEELRQAAEAILVRRGVVGLLHLDVQQVIHERPLRAYGQRTPTSVARTNGVRRH